jgi:4-amino-4-deoxy-L-arabinose transferase-like glycosyltransferase
MVRGAAEVPYTLQYRGTLPYLYPIVQQAIWGMGPALAAISFGGLAVAAVRAVRRSPTRAGWVALCWAVPFFAFVGGLYVKFPRYFVPLSPLLAVYGAGWLTSLRRVMRAVIGALAVVSAGLISLGLVLSYAQPHPWVEASRWMEAHLPPEAVVAVEAWDHPLPLSAERFEIRTLPVFAPASDANWDAMEAKLAEADAVVIASRRGYGALAHRSSMAVYYRSLFAGQRGFEAPDCFGRWPRVGALAVSDDPFEAADLPLPGAGCLPQPPVLWLPPLDESFVVYDHPTAIVMVRK